MSLRIGRGFYEDGIWADGGFMPYSHIGGLTWREDDTVTLVLMHRMRQFARQLTVPHPYYGAARRLLRDKIAAHDIHFTGKSLDLGLHDERDDVYPGCRRHRDRNVAGADYSHRDVAAHDAATASLHPHGTFAGLIPRRHGRSHIFGPPRGGRPHNVCLIRRRLSSVAHPSYSA